MNKLNKFSAICPSCSFVFNILGKSPRKEGIFVASLNVYLKNKITSHQTTKSKTKIQNSKIRYIKLLIIMSYIVLLVKEMSFVARHFNVINIFRKREYKQYNLRISKLVI